MSNLHQVGCGAESVIHALSLVPGAHTNVQEIMMKIGSVETRSIDMLALEASIYGYVIKINHSHIKQKELKNLIVFFIKLATKSTVSLPESLELINKNTPFVVNHNTNSIVISIDNNVVMKRMDGTLRDLYSLSCNNRLYIIHVLEAVLGSLAVLSVMHSLYTFHCDIKEDNILYSYRNDEYQFALTDFGHMRTLYHSTVGVTSRSRSLGTPGSRCPFMYSSEDGQEEFVDDNIMPARIASSPHRIWEDYELARMRTTKRMQMIKNDLFAIGVMLSRIVHPSVELLAKCFVFATHKDVDPVWSVADGINRINEMILEKPDAFREPVVLDRKMPGV